jgi:hypothetical protein
VTEAQKKDPERKSNDAMKAAKNQLKPQEPKKKKPKPQESTRSP